MCVYTNIYIYIYIYIYIFFFLFIYLYIYLFICMHAYMRVHDMHTYTFMPVGEKCRPEWDSVLALCLSVCMRLAMWVVL